MQVNWRAEEELVVPEFHMKVAVSKRNVENLRQTYGFSTSPMMIRIWTICAVVALAMAEDIDVTASRSTTTPSRSTTTPSMSTTTPSRSTTMPSRSTTTPNMPTTTLQKSTTAFIEPPPDQKPDDMREVAMCGLHVYFPKTHLCCLDKITPKISEFTKCCGKYRYDSRFMICCGEFIGFGKFARCCNGKDVYDIVKQMCCAGKVRNKKKPEEYCCGMRVCTGQWL
ncbi:hypothetical protein LSAT2_019055 [Lamellibrachia satsuma]|nr:hypothetical protein LSAT2_019055 [Lamellibrachia satsuma]